MLKESCWEEGISVSESLHAAGENHFYVPVTKHGTELAPNVAKHLHGVESDP